MSARLVALPQIEEAVWRELALATHDKQHGWRTAVLATVHSDAADARTVILREADAAARTLTFFTDDRAAKVAQLLSHPNATLLMWSAALGWQIRCRAVLSIESNGLAATSRWARIKVSPAAQDYLSRVPPGTAIESPDDASVGPGPLDREHFAVVTAQVHAIDWLELHDAGHRRAVFDASGARWVQP